MLSGSQNICIFFRHICRCIIVLGFGIYVFSLSLCSLMTVDGIMICLQRNNSLAAYMH